MYFRRFTRMTLYPAIKYFSKYGAIDKGYQKFMPLFTLANQNQPADQPVTRKLSKAQLKEKDLDTKLIDRLFLKYPDLKYEPISSQKYNGRKLNTFSYAYSFIAQQKKLIKQGYTIQKSFEIVEQKYQQQMKRKLDQTLLSRGLAIGNRARSFLTLYQQQVEYQSRLKVMRTRRQIQKYEDKLNKLRSRIQTDDNDAQQLDQFSSYERMFTKISRPQNLNKQTKQSGKQLIEQRNQMVNKVQKQFKNVFNQFYQRVTYKDRLEGLTDQEIMKNIHSSPNRIKRQNKLLIEFLKKKGSVTVDHVGQVRVSENQNPKLREFLLTSPQVKIALLTEKLNYQKPITMRQKNKGALFARRSQILRNRPDRLTKQQFDLIRYNKRRDMQTVSQSDFPNSRQVYKIFQSAQQRLLRLQLKYLDLMCEKQLEQQQKKRQEQDTEGESKHKKKYEQAQYTLGQTIQKFRRLKYRLENKFRKSTADQFVFGQHVKLGDEATAGDEADYEDLMLYLRKRAQQRRLTSISQSNDNRIHSYLVEKQVPEYPQTQGEVKSKIQ